MGIPGFLRGSRWEHVDNTHHFFVLYELEGYDVLTSPGYMERLNAPTPWSTKMMPHHQGMVRSQCTVELAHGGGMGTAVLAIRCAPARRAYAAASGCRSTRSHRRRPEAAARRSGAGMARTPARAAARNA